MRWVGKRDAYHNAFLPTQKILNPLPDESKHWDTTGNLLLRGDNIEALRLLRHSYFGAIKLIYIDPPYNTKSDGFIYNDNFSQNQTEVLEKLGYDKDNIDYIKNIYGAKTHSGWLSFMYPRLLLAKDLLTEDGVIFISIDHNELAQLRLICDEVFGDDNFIEIFSWTRTSTPAGLDAKSRKTNEYIVCYEKSANSIKYNGSSLDGGDQPLLNRGNSERVLSFPPNSIKFSKKYFADGKYNNIEALRVSILGEFEIKDGYNYTQVNIKGEFKWQESTLEKELSKNTTFLIKSRELSIRFIRQEEGFKRPNNYIQEKHHNPNINKQDNQVDTNEAGSEELKQLFGATIFDNPKPSSLIRYLISFFEDEDLLVLDFFAGSGTTGEAVMRLNAEDGGNRKFILVQIPQAIDPKEQKEAYRFVTEDLGKPATIFEITAERLRRAGADIEKSMAAKPEAERKSIDTGFRVFDIVDDAEALILQKPLSQATQSDFDLFTQVSQAEITPLKIQQVITNLLLAEELSLSTQIKEIMPNKFYLAGNVGFILSTIDLEQFSATITHLKQSGTPAVYLTVYAPWVRDDNFMQSIKTLAETIGYSSDKLRLRGYGA